MLIRQTLLYLPAQLIGPLFQFIAAIVWTHWLLPDAYGVLTFIMAAQELAFVLCMGWWTHYTLRYVGSFSNGNDRRRFQDADNAIMLAATAVQALIGVVVLKALGQPMTTLLVAGTVVFITTRTMTSHLLERARARGSIMIYTGGQIIGPVLGFGTAYAAVACAAATPEAAIAGFALAQVLGLAWLWRALGLGVSFALPQRALLAAALGYGLPLLGAGVIGWISLNGIRVIVEHMRGVDAVGLVSVGWGLGQRLASVVAMLVTAAAYPLAVQHLQAGRRDEALAQLSNNGALLLALLAPSVVGIFMLAPEAVSLMIAAPFQEVTLAVLPLALVAGMVRNLRVHFADQVFLLMAKTHLMVYINLVEAGAVTVLCAFGLHVGGFAGATAGCLAGSTIGTILGFAVGRIKFGLPLPVAHAARILLATAAMGVALALPPWLQFAPLESARLLLKIGAGALTYGMALALLYPGFVALGTSRLRGLRVAAH